MFFRLLFLLTFIPFIEIYFLLRLSSNIGFGNTVLVVLATGVLGAWLLRKQGHSILMELQQSSMQNQLPSDTIAKGFFTFVGGVLLLTPGILTDAIGLSLIFPLTQIFWKNYFLGQFKKGMASGNVHFYSSVQTPQGRQTYNNGQRENFGNQKPRHSLNHDVIDVEAHTETVDSDKKD